MQIFGRPLVSPKSKILAKTKDFRNPSSRKFTYLGMVSAQLSTSEIEHYFKCFQVSDQKRFYISCFAMDFQNIYPKSYSIEYLVTVSFVYTL